jgi:hypothetical protein
MPYSPQAWIDFDPTKPVSAARMTHIEDGIATVDAAATNASNITSGTLAAARVGDLSATYVPGDATTVADRYVPRWSTSASKVVFKALPRIDAAADYGVKANDSAVAVANSTALQAAVTALAASTAAGGTIELPPGQIYLNGTITIPVDRHIQIEGTGISHSGGTRWGTVLYRASAFSGDMISAVGTGSTSGTRCLTSLVNLGINGNSVASVIARFARTTDLILDHVRFSNSGSESLVMTNVWNALISNCFFHTSGNGSTTPAVRMDAPTGEDGCNGNFFANCQWEGNNGIGLKITGAANWSIVNHFTNCKWEDASAATWPVVELDQAAATIFNACWMMKGRLNGNVRATGPLFRQLGSVPTTDGERRANIISSSQLSYWGDTTQLIDHQAGPLVISGNSFTGIPTAAYIDVTSAVGVSDLVVIGNYAEHPDLLLRDGRTTRRTNTTNGRLGAMAPSARGWTGSAQAVSANNGRLCRFVPERNMRVKGIGFNVVVAAGSNDNFDVGIYDSTLTKIVSSGATAGKLNATGKKRIDITETPLIEGQSYYILGSVGTLGGTAAQLVGANFTSAGIAAFMGTTAGLVEADAAATIHPLPTGPITPAGGSTAGFAFFLHED